jgi:MFS family permease
MRISPIYCRDAMIEHNCWVTSIVPAAGQDVDSPAAGLGRNRNYQRVWFAGAVSGFGDVVFVTAAVVWVGTIIARGQTWAPLAVSGVLIAEMIPAVLLGPIGGVYADRWDRRRMMLATDLARALIIGLLLLLPSFGERLSTALKLAIVYAAVLLASAFTQFFGPARFSAFGTVVADPDRERAGSIAQGTDATAAILGAPIAASLVVNVAYGVQWSLAVNAASFLVSFVAVLGVRLPVTRAEAREREPRSVGQDMRAGLRVVLGSRALHVIVSAVVLVTFAVSAINVLDLFFVTRNLHASAGYYGVLDAAVGAGMVLGSVVFAVVGRRVPAFRVFSLGLVCCGLGIVAYSRSTMLWVAVVILFVIGVPLAGVNSMIGPMVFREVPRDLLGRVLGLLNPVQQVASAAAIVLSTWLASTVLRSLDASALGTHFGPVDTIFLAAGVFVVAVGLWATIATRGMVTPPKPAASVASEAGAQE